MIYYNAKIKTERVNLHVKLLIKENTHGITQTQKGVKTKQEKSKSKSEVGRWAELVLTVYEDILRWVPFT